MMRFIFFIFLLLFQTNLFAANVKITEMTEDTAPTTDDLTVTVNAPSGSAANRKVTLANLTKGLNVSNVTTGTLPVANGGTGATALTDLITLGTHTTGGYAASVSEAGPATTATALAANGGNCSAGEYPLGVDASGAVESCTDATTEIAAYAQPLDSDLTDLADGSLTASKVAGVADADYGDVSVSSGTWSVDANSVALGTDTTGGYAASTTEGGGATSLEADGVDALTEIAQSIKSAADDTSKLVVGTAGSNGEVAKWNTDGTLTDANVIFGTLTDGKWCSYSSSGTSLSCTQDAPAGSGDVTGVADCADGACYDGSSDGGTYVRLYDGDSHYTGIVSSNVSANTTITLPATTGTLLLTNGAGTSLTALDGENIQDDTIDDDSIDFSDVTLADLTFDVGSVDTTEYGYLNGVTSAIQTQLDAKLALAGGTMTGNVTLGENASVALDPAGSADGKYTGITVTGTAGYTQAFGDLVYIDPTDSRWEAVDANSAAAADGDARGALGMVVSAGTDGNACTILLHGVIRADAKFPSFTVNNPVYASETAGSVTQTQPTTASVVIRVVGFAITADEMIFSPSSDYITHT